MELLDIYPSGFPVRVRKDNFTPQLECSQYRTDKQKKRKEKFYIVSSFLRREREKSEILRREREIWQMFPSFQRNILLFLQFWYKKEKFKDKKTGEKETLTSLIFWKEICLNISGPKSFAPNIFAIEQVKNSTILNIS